MGVRRPWDSHGMAVAKAMKLGVGSAGFGVSPLLPPPQSVLGKVNEIAKHKATVQDADTQSKVGAGGEAPLKASLAWWGTYGAPPPDCAHPPF